jgi:hypothetical protein
MSVLKNLIRRSTMISNKISFYRLRHGIIAAAFFLSITVISIHAEDIFKLKASASNQFKLYREENADYFFLLNSFELSCISKNKYYMDFTLPFQYIYDSQPCSSHGTIFFSRLHFALGCLKTISNMQLRIESGYSPRIFSETSRDRHKLEHFITISRILDPLVISLGFQTGYNVYKDLNWKDFPSEIGVDFSLVEVLNNRVSFALGLQNDIFRIKDMWMAGDFRQWEYLLTYQVQVIYQWDNIEFSLGISNQAGNGGYPAIQTGAALLSSF